ncbi:MAG: phasin family protein [Hyphococcus sp.]
MARPSSTKSSTKGKPTAEPFPVFDPGAFTTVNNRNLEVATRAARACFNGAAEFNKEMIGFVNARLKKDMESASALMGSKTSEDAFQTQAAFVEQAFRDYAEEASKMLNMAADIARQALEPDEPRAQETRQSAEEGDEQPKAAD